MYLPFKYNLVSLQKSVLDFMVTQMASGRGLYERDPVINSANLKFI